VKKLSYRYQRTIARPVEADGVGFVTGAALRMRFQPAPPGTGVVFVRTDLPSALPIPAQVDYVTGTQRRTTLGRAPHEIGMVEHVLAALAALRIDNCLIHVNGPETPGFDGSAQRYVQMLRRAGAILQSSRRAVYTVESTVTAAQDGASLTIYPALDQLKISYALDYGALAPIARQLHTHVITPEGFINGLADCRTFILEAEAAEFRRRGWGSRTTPADLLVFGSRGPIDNRLRYADEPARHKILDLVGDLALFGHDLRGHIVACRSGHPLNVQLARTLTRQLARSCHAQRLAA
jgi:UDP-3-O-acyl N-acetylglucosamine deacetylase